ncbi:Phage-related baseplate assembly protein [Bartonella vinsonii subsp. berkhoffii str. Tweed]|uniref:Phage-related baseplate assembly protein n=2 Tax=Bartonella vinsonii subsp. berkhoffii str. Tweed TaxID=1094502 RepID=N6VWK2_BARVB|nr:phage-related baseplate assembly protein [Bartonella vinsonii subsp. berkhoffii str. Tweed]ENN95492.1 Phage-related baseplate assembly protein [Bartonella vinsonii subsp. berkhoffii str. Tweed]
MNDAHLIATTFRQIMKRLDGLERCLANQHMIGRVAEVDGHRVRVQVSKQGSNGKAVLSPWLQAQEASGTVSSNMPLNVGDPVRLFNPHGEIGSASLVVRDSYSKDAPNPARSFQELALCYAGGALRITKDELILSHGENQIHLSSQGLVLSHQTTRVELTGSVHIQAEDLQHNQTSVGASHIHGGGQNWSLHNLSSPLKEFIMREKTYVILTNADFVAGKRSPGKGEEICLSDEAAQYPLLLGQIAEKPSPVASTTKTTKGV